MSDRDYSKIGQNNPLQTLDNTLDVDELQMRQTLGLSGRGRPQARAQVSNQPKQRHRFVQDGEVQVTHLSGPHNEPSSASRAKIAALESSLVVEQAARARAEHAVQAGIAQIHAIETKLAHVELATKDMLAAERKAREQVEQALSAALTARDQALQQAAELAATIKLLETPKIEAAAKPAPRVAKVKTAPRAKLPRVKEPKPVKWWLSKTPAKKSTRPAKNP